MKGLIVMRSVFRLSDHATMARIQRIGAVAIVSVAGLLAPAAPIKAQIAQAPGELCQELPVGADSPRLNRVPGISNVSGRFATVTCPIVQIPRETVDQVRVFVNDIDGNSTCVLWVRQNFSRIRDFQNLEEVAPQNVEVPRQLGLGIRQTSAIDVDQTLLPSVRLVCGLGRGDRLLSYQWRVAD